MSFLKVAVFLLLFFQGARAELSERSVEDMIKQLEEAKESTVRILEDTARQLGIEDADDFQLCALFRESVYEIMKGRGAVTEDGWIMLGETSDGSMVYMKLDRFCNVYKRVVSVKAGVSPDTGDLERQKEIPPRPSFTFRVSNTYAFVGFLLTSASALFLLYGTASAIMSKQLLTAFGRGIMFFVLSAISYVFLKSLVGL